MIASIHEVEPYELTLAERIHSITGNIDWIQQDSWTAIWGQIFSIQDSSVFEASITNAVNKRDYLEALFISRLADINNYSSPIILSATQVALQQFPMVGSLPLTATSTNCFGDPNVLNNGAFLLYDRFLVWSYLHSEDKTKWNITQAYSDFVKLYEKNVEMLLIDPQENWPKSFASRYYDEHAETLSMFLKFAETGIPEALLYADKEWQNIQSHWTGEFYGYWLDDFNGVECEMGNFAQIIAEYKQIRGDIPYWDRVIQDLNFKLLQNGSNSRGWSSVGVIKHADTNPEQRLGETMGAIMALHELYPFFTDEMKTSFRNILFEKAWKGLLSSELYSDGKFMVTNGSSVSDDATIIGSAILFLEGIVPDSGSLSITPREERYWDYRTSFLTSQFKFDYEKHKIRIPINVGNLTFIYGDEPVSYNFTSSGVFTIQFSDDWNKILQVVNIANLTEISVIPCTSTLVLVQSNNSIIDNESKQKNTTTEGDIQQACNYSKTTIPNEILTRIPSNTPVTVTVAQKSSGYEFMGAVAVAAFYISSFAKVKRSKKKDKVSRLFH